MIEVSFFFTVCGRDGLGRSTEDSPTGADEGIVSCEEEGRSRRVGFKLKKIGRDVPNDAFYTSMMDHAS